MNTEMVQNASDMSANLAHLTHEVSKARTLVEDAIEDGKLKAQRLIRRSKIRAEDCVDETTYFLKHHPWQSVGVALGVGAGVGVLAGWLVSRSATCRDSARTSGECLENFHSGE